MAFAPRETVFTGPPTTVVHGMTHTVDDVGPALRERCPIDLAILSRWFLEHDAGDCAAALADAALSKEVAA